MRRALGPVFGLSLCRLFRQGLHNGLGALPRAARQAAIVLAQHAEQQVNRLVGHVDDGSDGGAERIIAPQERGLVRQVLLDGLEDVRIEELCVRRCFEEAVVGDVVEGRCRNVVLTARAVEFLALQIAGKSGIFYLCSQELAALPLTARASIVAGRGDLPARGGGKAPGDVRRRVAFPPKRI